METWTFVIECNNGSTLVSQASGSNISEAMRKFNASKLAVEYKIHIPSSIHTDDGFDYDPPVQIQGTKNVWCVSYIDEADLLVLMTVIKTVS